MKTKALLTVDADILDSGRICLFTVPFTDPSGLRANAIDSVLVHASDVGSSLII